MSGFNFKNFWNKKKNILYPPSTEKVLVLKDKIRGLEIEKDKFIALQKITATLVADLDFERITQEIVDIMVKDLGYPGGVLYLINEKSGEVQGWTVSQTKLAQKALGLLTKSVREHKAFIDKQEHYVSKTANMGEVFIDSNFTKFVSPTIPYKIASMIQKIVNFKIIISLPIIVKKKIIGVLMFTSNKEKFTPEEIDVLKTFANQAGIAINNARQYEQIQTQVRALKEKTQDLRSLLDISEIAASSLETKNITQKIVDSIPDKLGHLEYLGGFLSMYNPKTTSVCAYSITESELVRKKIKIYLPKPFGEYCAYANRDKNLMIEAILTGKAQTSENLDKFICPPLDLPLVKKIQKSMGIKSNIAFPIFIRGQIIGVMMFFAKKPLKEMGERDTNLIKAFVDHVGISIDNAMLFDRAIKQLKDLARAKEKLEQTLAMKGEFMHIVSHQLRTPLTTVRGLISMWYDGDFEKMPDEKRKSFRERIKISVEKLNNITNQMLKAMEFEGAVVLKIEKVDLIKMLKEITDLLRPNFEKKGLYLKFDNQTGEEKFIIDADANYISHAFNNIIDNAEKYTIAGGAAISVSAADKYARVKVRDTGIGISGENKKRLFKKFSRGVDATKDNPSGSGLGLFIVKKIISEHKGEISFESERVGHGAAFTVSLPVKQGKK